MSQCYVKSFENLSQGTSEEILEWCRTNLYNGGHNELHWYHVYDGHGTDFFYFFNVQEYEWFLLKWS